MGRSRKARNEARTIGCVAETIPEEQRRTQDTPRDETQQEEEGTSISARRSGHDTLRERSTLNYASFAMQ